MKSLLSIIIELNNKKLMTYQVKFIFENVMFWHSNFYIKEIKLVLLILYVVKQVFLTK